MYTTNNAHINMITQRLYKQYIQNDEFENITNKTKAVNEKKSQ